MTTPKGELLILAERGDEFVVNRIEPPASGLFYMESSDGSPEPIEGSLDEIFRDRD